MLQWCCLSSSSFSRSRRQPSRLMSTSLSRFGWEWRADKSADANWLDLAYMLSRNSIAIDGHMGCCVVRGDDVLVESINHGLFSAFRSDVHAEAGAISDAARRGVSLEAATLYVTKAPCKNCYRLIAESGVSRIVAPNAMEAKETEHATQIGLGYTVLRDDPDRREWRDAIAAPFRDQAAIDAQRAMRKRVKDEAKRQRSRRLLLQSSSTRVGSVSRPGALPPASPSEDETTAASVAPSLT